MEYYCYSFESLTTTYGNYGYQFVSLIPDFSSFYRLIDFTASDLNDETPTNMLIPTNFHTSFEYFSTEVKLFVKQQSATIPPYMLTVLCNKQMIYPNFVWKSRKI